MKKNQKLQVVKRFALLIVLLSVFTLSGCKNLVYPGVYDMCGWATAAVFEIKRGGEVVNLANYQKGTWEKASGGIRISGLGSSNGVYKQGKRSEDGRFVLITPKGSSLCKRK